MEIAKVIVDVPVRSTDRPFDYSIPDALRLWIEVGSRVAVPFGHRTVQGFVVSLESGETGTASGLKPIQEVLDLLPPLSPELVELGDWMSQRYACRRISALQAMLPTALKGKAERLISLGEEAEAADKPADELFPLFLEEDLEERTIIDFVRKAGEVSMKQLTRSFPGAAETVKFMLRRGVLTESQSIKDKMGKKKLKAVDLAIGLAAARESLSTFPARSARQKDVLSFLVEMEQMLPMPMKDLLAVLQVTAGTVKALEEKGYIEISEIEVYRDPYRGRDFKSSSPLPLTPEQQKVFTRIARTVDEQQHEVFLLHGVTGSGKTEIYLQCIQRAMDQGRQAVVLVPEIALTPQMVERFKGRFGSGVAVMHSRLSVGERYDEWRKIREGKAMVAVGARSAVFAPFANLGLIIMDEEHESSYKQEENPKYHARDVAVRRAEQGGAAVILGSATPSLESYHAARAQSDIHFSPVLLEMPTRALGNELPKVHVVDMRDELKEGNRSMFSRRLHAALESRLEKGEQTVLLLNRRGFSTFVMCRSCGYVATCPECDISLTYHSRSDNLRCHYCGHAEPSPKVCPECGSEHIRFFGTGTQRVEEELGKLFPGIRVIRMDVDTTTEKGSHEKLLNQFRDKKADVLLGTQMVAKGLDFPDVTLVGVITADSALNLPDFRAGEKTFQLLTQVAGRAGRHQLPGEVVVQSYTPEHYSIVHASGHDYYSFVREELKHRRALHYPPYCRLILVTLSHEQLPLLLKMAENYALNLQGRARQLRWFASLDKLSADALDLLGPVASPLPKLKGRYRFQCIIKWRGAIDAIGLARQIAEELEDSVRDNNLQISIDVDPQMLM
ncbi:MULTISPECIES: primosomal protein N' [unclassified Paenibacillus]|uniref:primosomal protein N' n=1 Tax=unclassified Paenibacillus TaxID=185978 RepID=UPI00240742A9|nr:MULTISPECIES: primosomal protein N' [unclassified Paenibacillus]MDF9842904.1 primosomal protein N' (replication factor Y) [Paenibacillus sp. PastF-2]MDF9849492.1 primosomal protein N' (replication factor Y) [Paenibacillus sp. PastM-2]MDF9856133.1 primosomal protein N' (replication factor Y) [Paenibacillus sp. PastF-1]MDH6481335.1 primosomal protein N' (replication factor Y) [Paenibacillus sp. PastH-2]MDH6508822.1 primosomal protein N' (replication factor Y) [Paenibacillus sp. PastM-3]